MAKKKTEVEITRTQIIATLKASLKLQEKKVKEAKAKAYKERKLAAAADAKWQEVWNKYLRLVDSVNRIRGVIKSTEIHDE